MRGAGDPAWRNICLAPWVNINQNNICAKRILSNFDLWKASGVCKRDIKKSIMWMNRWWKERGGDGGEKVENLAKREERRKWLFSFFSSFFQKKRIWKCFRAPLFHLWYLIGYKLIFLFVFVFFPPPPTMLCFFHHSFSCAPKEIFLLFISLDFPHCEQRGLAVEFATFFFTSLLFFLWFGWAH